MAQHDLSDLVTRINAIGADLADLLAIDGVDDLHARYPKAERNVIAWNVEARAAAYARVERMERAARPAVVTTDTPLATEKQVAFAVRLIGSKRRDGDTSGFVSFRGGHPTPEALAHMTRRDISTLIDSLTSNY